MSLQQFIRNIRESKSYFRGLVVRAIEDAIILVIGGVAIWAVCALVSGFFRILGVG